MLAFLGITGALIAAFIGGYVVHMFLPLSTVWGWVQAVWNKVF